MSSNSNPFDSKLRNILWPIHNYELKKFIPISALMFCILFNQNILRILKDSILIAEVSAEVTSFTKVYVVTPMAAVFVIVYAKLVNHLSFDKIFYYLISIFTSFYFAFAFVIYPNIDVLHMQPEQLQHLMTAHPHFKWYIAIIGNWSYVLYYSFSELWPNIFYVLLFWQIANEITNTNEAKRFYMLFSLFGNSSLVIVGIMMSNLSNGHNWLIKYFFPNLDNKVALIQTATIWVVLSSVIACFLVRHIANYLMINTTIVELQKLKTKPKMGIMDSFGYIVRSKYLWLMLICTASFGLSMNLIEAVWKAKMKELYPSVNAYAAFNSIYILWTGVAIMLMTVIGNNVIRNRSWFTAAVISPIIILVTGVIFFILVVWEDQVGSLLDGIILMSPLALAVVVGAIQNILSKGSKYSIWDTSRQMLYIPLDQELRTKGKAAVDVVSPKIGKSASGLVQSMTFTVLPMATYNSIAPVLMLIFVAVCALWIYAIGKINFEYQKML